MTKYIANVSVGGLFQVEVPRRFDKHEDAISHLVDSLKLEALSIKIDLASGYLNRMQAAKWLLAVRAAINEVRRTGTGQFGDNVYEVYED